MFKKKGVNDLRKHLYRKTDVEQGSLWYSYKELNLNKKKMYVTEKKFPDLYSNNGFINLGNEAHFHSSAKMICMKLLDGMENACIYFVPLYEKPFVCYKGESGEVELKVVGYFDTAKTVFEKIEFDKDYQYIGLIEEVDPEKWDIIEE